MTLVDVLGLRVRIDGDSVTAEPRSGRVDLEVSLLAAAAWPPELLLAPERVCYADQETDEAGRPTLVVWQCGAEFYRVRYWDGSEFLVDRAGTRVWARWPANLPIGEILVCLFGPIIGFVLHLRGTPCLHASAVVIDGRAVAFLGHSGAGKSTMAAAFVRRGFAALTDDVLALDFSSYGGASAFALAGFGETPKAPPHIYHAPPHSDTALPRGEYYVRPGHNVVRLAPDAVRALYGAEDALPHGGDTTDKRHLELTAGGNRLPAGPAPLGAIYVLHERRPDLDRPVAIDDLKGHVALMALVSRTYLNYVLDAELRTRALDVFARLAACVPVRQLIVRDDAADLGAVTEAILADVRRDLRRGAGL
jgi:hypothetical protein